MDTATRPRTSPAAGTAMRLASEPHGLVTACRNVRMMHYLERLALHFNLASVPVMVLKGAALNMTIYAKPDQRPMRDIDLLVRPEDVDRAIDVLQRAGCRRLRYWVREDFFPRYYFEAEFTSGDLMPVTIDLHVRPFRPLRYVKLLNDSDIWDHAVPHPLGDAEVMLPGPEAMLIHLCAHCAFHGEDRPKWPRDIRQWIAANEGRIDWARFIDTVAAWRMNLAVLRGIAMSQGTGNALLPAHVHQALIHMPTNWRDWLVLRQAPRDEFHPISHLIVTALTTPDLNMVAGFLKSTLLPDRQHMLDWYGHEHPGWLPLAHLLRLAQPITRRLRFLWSWACRFEVAATETGELGVIAQRDFRPGQSLGKLVLGEASDDERFSVGLEQPDGRVIRRSLRGKLRFLQSSDRPNARLEGLKLFALRRIKPDDPITISPDRLTSMPLPEPADSDATRFSPAAA